MKPPGSAWLGKLRQLVFPPKRNVKYKRVEVYAEMKCVFNLRVGWVMVQTFQKKSFSIDAALCASN